MSDLKDSLGRFYEEVANRGNLDVFDELLHDDYVEHEDLPGVPATKAGTRTLFQMLRGAFPDLHMAVEDMVEEGDTVAARVRMSGTHKGEFMGMPATGKRFDIQVMDFLQFSGGQVIAHWGVMDAAGMMEQLGVAPGPA